MKKTLALIVSCMLLFVLAACGGDKDSASPNETGVTDTGVAPEAELVISATNYQFDKQEYTLKKGVPVKITFKNEEGNHGVLIPALNLQLDSKNDSAVVTPDKTGEFDISCSIMCGPGHTKMISKLIIEE
ncbi:cytochrome c oxidase subunit II [Paenibacillus sp. DMB20]|uniref:cytochrome c oxidase subunit II n=1 Tax=Paenibacillus sp. DMB20 TaxID=1642570 RepID=UPI00062812ED|nr:cytochrome c oxidase subunit II [Paenibacillus sp. DMB20]KKO52940.1 cytochrome C oxidase subunit II [Paenibacillus sp. DMB20]KKO53815.1 cytochrome C oxidase subunit II [Paenibacillus sp. DMB20]